MVGIWTPSLTCVAVSLLCSLGTPAHQQPRKQLSGCHPDRSNFQAPSCLTRKCFHGCPFYSWGVGVAGRARLRGWPGEGSLRAWAGPWAPRHPPGEAPPAPPRAACFPSRWTSRAANRLGAAGSCSRELERNSFRPHPSCQEDLWELTAPGVNEHPEGLVSKTLLWYRGRNSGAPVEESFAEKHESPLPLPAADRFQSVQQDNGLRLQASSPPTVYQEPPKHFSLQSWLDTLHSEWPAAVSPNRDLRPGRRLLYFEAALNCASAETCLFSPSEEIKILKCLLAKGTAASLSLKCKSARSTLARARVGWRKAACPCDLTPSISPI
uniref:uncharacterized protein LOC118527174 n=1 Tax=Halichoerus grypus TaxID=9711 RepID=UPI001658D31F|nr:uncharacterized protein LOC118527174 [Halichoerus grypus]